MRKYSVKQGDYVASIAAELGIRDYRAIWNDPGNSVLKQTRLSPNVLYPGDSLIVPDSCNKQYSRQTDQTHKFEVARNHVHLRVVLQDTSGTPISGAKCLLQLDKGERLASNSAGLIDEEINPAGPHTGTLTVGNSKCSLDDQYDIWIGYLNPLSKPSGQIARLNNLGYRAGSLETGLLLDKLGTQDSGDDIIAGARLQLRSAVEEFQCDTMGHSAVDGICGPQTQAKLKQIYGC